MAGEAIPGMPMPGIPIPERSIIIVPFMVYTPSLPSALEEIESPVEVRARPSGHFS
jgi:hypothetical protein